MHRHKKGVLIITEQLPNDRLDYITYTDLHCCIIILMINYAQVYSKYVLNIDHNNL